MRAEALIKIPSFLKASNTRIGVLFGNFGEKPAINFEIHQSGSIRIFWNDGEVDLKGSTDLRDGKWNHVMFERTRGGIQLFVNGHLEALGRGGRDVPKRQNGTWIGHDWRDQGMAFRGEILALKIQGEHLFEWKLYDN